MTDKRYGVKGRIIYDAIKGSLNIKFADDESARICCQLLNQKEDEIETHVDKLDEVFKWHKKHYGKSILDVRMGW